MKKAVWIWQFFGFAVTTLLGTVLHFLYDWLERAVWIAPFSGVNESTWEHMKLLFWPMFIYAMFQSFFFKEYENFWCINLKGTLLGLSLIPVIFYTYNGVVGKSADWINIAIFFICAAIAYIYKTRAFKKGNGKCRYPRLAFLALCTVAFLFVIFTFKTPEIAMFKDPVTKPYGI